MQITDGSRVEAVCVLLQEDSVTDEVIERFTISVLQDDDKLLFYHKKENISIFYEDTYHK